MADNVTLNSGSGGDTISADDIAGVKVQRVKVQYGVDASATDVSDTNPLPVDDAGGSLTVDNAALSVTGGGVEASALRVTLASDSTGVLSVDDNGSSLTIDGTVTANLSATDNAVLDSIDTAVNGTLTVGSHAVTNAGTFAVQISDTSFAVADGNALGEGVLIQGDDGTDRKNINVDATTGDVQVDVTNTVTVASHAVTNAGTFAVQVDGDALTALQTIDNSIFADDAAFTLATSSVNVSGAIRDDSLTTLTAIEGDAVPLRVSSTGALHVTGGGGGTEYSEDDATPATITGTATVMERDDALASLTPIEGDWAAMRCSAEGALWVQEFNSDAILADTANMDTNLGTVAGAVSGTEMQVDVVAALPAGTNAIGKLAANTGVDIGDVDVTSISAGSNLIGDVGISGARTSGGTTIFRSIDLDETEEEIKATGGQVYWIHAMNLTAATVYLKFYNLTAANTTVGTSTPVLTFPIATQGDTNGAGFVLSIPNGIAFGTAITAAVTTGVADNDTTGPAANGCVVNIGYA